jgi:RNA-directed DNA polymerase
MKESYGEGVAIHTGPESCSGGSNVTAEALTGVRAGRVVSREILLESRVPTLWDAAEGNIGRVGSARYARTLRGRGPRARTETPRAGTGRSHICLRREGFGGRIGKSEDVRQ